MRQRQRGATATGARRRSSDAPRDDLRQEVAGVVMAAIGGWLAFALAGSGGRVGDSLAAGVRALVGGTAAWLVPPALVALGVYMIYLREGFRLTRRLWGLGLMTLAFVVAVELYAYPVPGWQAGDVTRAGAVQDFENARNGLGGGIIGWAAGMGVSLFGRPGRWVVLGAAGVIGFVLATEVSLSALMRGLWSRLRAAGGSLAARRAARPPAGAAGRRPEGLRPDAVAAVAAGRAGPGTATGAGPPPRSLAGVLGLGKARPDAQAAGGPSGQPADDRPPLKIHLAGQETAEPPAAPAGAAGPGRAGGLPAGAVGAAGGVGAAGASVVSGAAGAAAATGATGAGVAGAGVAGAAAGAGGAGAAGGAGGTGRKGARGEGGKEERAGLRLVRQGDQWQTQLQVDPTGAQEYHLPPLELLRKEHFSVARDVHRDIMDRARHLEEVLHTYGVPGKVVEVHQGPTITRFELTVEAGTKINRVTALADDLAYHLAAPDIRIEAPIPGKRAIGIEVPNQEIITVHLREVLESPEFLQNPSKLTVGLGKDIAGKPIVGMLDRMPHLLIAGATGSGKSVCLNGIICSLLVKARPDEVKMLMIDPKRVELAGYDGIPHLMAPVCTDPRKAAGYLKWAVREMETRYDLFAAAGVRNITHYNEWVRQNPDYDDESEEERKPLPYVVVVIDELADLMMVAPVDVEDAICRLAQMARACGMHLVVATQRPSVDVITGLIKANIPSRIAFATSSQVDSRTILDMGGAEKLLGKGDMLFHPAGAAKPVRAQGAFISDKEVESLVSFVKQQGRPVYVAESLEGELSGKHKNGADAEKEKESAADAVFAQAVRVVVEHGQASVSILQRRLRCNYTKAARLIDMMEERGFIGPHQGPKPRDVLISMPQWEQLFGGLGEEAASEED